MIHAGSVGRRLTYNRNRCSMQGAQDDTPVSESPPRMYYPTIGISTSASDVSNNSGKTAGCTGEGKH